MTTYDKKNPTASDPFFTALRAYQQLQSLNGCLAQSLGGFSDALLTYNRTIQLDVNDNLLTANGPAKDFLKNVQNTLELRDLRGNNIPARKSLCRRIRPARWHIIKAQVP
jgi:hypothetical protein